jgi:nucleoside-diphosphate-sugar epimerase
MKNHLFCFGWGYTAQALIKEIHASSSDSWLFSGTKRVLTTPQSEITKLIEFDKLTLIPQNVTHILISIPPNLDGDIVFDRFANHFLKLPKLKWVGYFSSSGVYGDHQGGWVDESTPTSPSNLRAASRLKAEIQWLSLFNKYKIPIHIFRLTAIYGYTRSEIEKILTGKFQIITKPNHYFSRIHVNDIVQILIQSFVTPTPGEIYNLSDDYPCPQAKVTEYACNLLKIPSPSPVSFQDAELSEMAKSFYLESRKVNNEKVKKILKVKLKFPTYKAGLEEIYNVYYHT